MNATTQVIPRVDVEAYREQGYVHVRGVFGRATVARMRTEADAILARVVAAGKNVEATWKGDWRKQMLGKPGNGGKASSAEVTALAAAVSSIHNVQYHAALLMQGIMDQRLTGAIAPRIREHLQLDHTQ